jgi:hypothetical protein
MTTTTKRRILGGVAATFMTIGLFWAYQKYSKASQMDELNRLSAELRKAPFGQNEELMKKFRVQMAKLTPDERMDFFEKGMDDRIDEYFKKTPEERKAWLDGMTKNRGRFGGTQGKGQRPPAKGKTAATRGRTLAKGKTGGASGKGQWGGRAGGGRGGPGAGGMGGGGGRGRGGTPEQRAQRRRERLDKTSPEQRAKRAEFSAAMRAARKARGGFGGFGRGGR